MLPPRVLSPGYPLLTALLIVLICVAWSATSASDRQEETSLDHDPRLDRARTYLAEHYGFDDEDLRKRVLSPGGVKRLPNWPFTGRFRDYSFYFFVTAGDHPGFSVEAIAVNDAGSVLFPARINDFNKLLKSERISLAKLTDLVPILHGYLCFFHITSCLETGELRDACLIDSVADIAFPETRKGRRQRRDIECRFPVSPPAIEFGKTPVYRFFTWCPDGGAVQVHRLYFTESGLVKYEIETLAQGIAAEGAM